VIIDGTFFKSSSVSHQEAGFENPSYLTKLIRFFLTRVGFSSRSSFVNLDHRRKYNRSPSPEEVVMPTCEKEFRQYVWKKHQANGVTIQQGAVPREPRGRQEIRDFMRTGSPVGQSDEEGYLITTQGKRFQLSDPPKKRSR